jgi:hypothetical protein
MISVKTGEESVAKLDQKGFLQQSVFDLRLAYFLNNKERFYMH